MRPFFGEFLVENEHITSEQLLQCLLEQQESQPSLAEIIFKRGTTPVEDQLAVLDEMSSSGNSYITCLKASHLMKKSEMKSLLSYSVETVPGLPEIIIANFMMKPADLVSALDEYISLATEEGLPEEDDDDDGIVAKSDIPVETTPAPARENTAPSPAAVVEPVAAEKTSSAVDIDPTPIESSLLPVFLEQFLVEDIESIRTKASGVGSVDDFLSFCRETNGKLELFKGMSKFIRASLLENVVTLSGDYLRVICTGENPSQEEMNQKSKAIMAALELIAEIRNSIESNNDEATYWNDAGNKAKYQDVVGSLAA